VRSGWWLMSWLVWCGCDRGGGPVGGVMGVSCSMLSVRGGVGHAVSVCPAAKRRRAFV